MRGCSSKVRAITGDSTHVVRRPGVGLSSPREKVEKTRYLQLVRSLSADLSVCLGQGQRHQDSRGGICWLVVKGLRVQAETFPPALASSLIHGWAGSGLSCLGGPGGPRQAPTGLENM